MTTVLVCEPQCVGFEHTEFNAALLRTADLAFPQSRILFAGEPEHVSLVRSRIEAHRGEPSRIEWATVDVPARHRSLWKRYGAPRLSAEGRWCAQARALAASTGATQVLLASLSPSGLYQWKSSAAPADPPTLAFLHGVVASAYGGGRIKGAGLRAIFRSRAAPGFRYAVLGESILEALRELDPALAGRFASLEVPSLWAAEPVPPAVDGPPAGFGYFGVSAKGFDTFAAIAARVRVGGRRARFTLVGFLNDGAPLARWADVVDGVAAAPLSPAEYARRARSVSYAVWTARPAAYRWTASASFVDAVAFAKPSIVLRNRYVERYFGQMGDIGYLCDSTDEMAATIESIAREFPADRYRAQRANLERGRARFTPAAIAGRLAALTSP